MIKLGIDFGTTRTAVAVADRGNFPLVAFSTPDGGALDHYPSVLAERDGAFLFGLDALERADAPGWTVLRSFKRLLANPAANLTTTVVVGSAVVRLVDLLAGFLEALRRDLLDRSNLPGRAEGATLECLVATPANAHSNQRLITLEAFRRAGFAVAGMMNEPSAAGVEFVHGHGGAVAGKREKVAIFDLGGGTFDASLVDLGDRLHHVVASAGLNDLGGDDLDRALMDETLRAAGLDARQLSARSRARLLEHCRQKKEALHPNTARLHVELGAQLDQVDRTIAGLAEDAVTTVAVADFYRAAEPLVDRAIAVMERVLARDGESASLDGVAAIHVVGGASSLPLVARRLRERWGRRVRRTPYGSGATAIGLAIALAEGVLVRERLARSFGVFREARGGAEVAFDPIFDAATEVPEAGAEPAVKVRRYRPVHNIGHFRFVECSALDDAGTPTGDLTPFEDVLFPFDRALRDGDGPLAGTPVARVEGPGALIEERYEIDDAGVVHVTIRDVETGFAREARLRRAG